MRDSIARFKNTLKRTLSNESISVKIYIFWGIVTIIFFGIYGFWPVSKIFVSNISLLDEMYKNNISMEKKIKELKEAKEKLDIVGDDAEILDRYLPNDFEKQTYVVEIATLARDSGYTLTNTTFGKVEESRVRISLKLEGKGKLGDFIGGLETSGRLTEIESIKLLIGQRNDSISIQVDSFIMNRR
jgi:Tfp pilus assembly protein PilO